MLTTLVRLLDGNLVVEDGTGNTPDQITIQADAANNRFRLSNGTSPFTVQNIPDATGSGTGDVSVPKAVLTGTEIRFAMGGGNDAVTIDFALGEFAPTIVVSVDGAGSNDTLRVSGSTPSTVSYLHQPGGNARLLVDNTTIVYAGIERTINDLTASGVLVDLAALSEAVSVHANETEIGARVSTPVTAAHLIRQPTQSLQIDAGANPMEVEGIFEVGSADFVVSAEELVVDANIATTGPGMLTIHGQRYVEISSGSTLSTEAGAIQVLGNQTDAQRFGGFNGVTISNATVESLSGEILIRGRGGNAADRVGNRGVLVAGNSRVESESGAVTIEGAGGRGSDLSRGVELSGGSVAVVSESGDISIIGRGGEGSGVSNQGIYLAAGVIESTGEGVDAGSITLDGVGGTGNDNNHGIALELSTSMVRARDGKIVINGTGGSGNGNANRGVNIQDGASVISAGTSSITSGIQIVANGGLGANDNDGLRISSPGSQITSVAGDIQVTGIASRETSASFNRGVVVEAEIASTGSGDVTITGLGGNGVESNDGLMIRGTNASVEAQAGTITLRGEGGTGSSRFQSGTVIANGASIRSNGDLAGQGAIIIDGLAGVGTSENVGVVFFGSPSLETNAANVRIAGTGSLDATGALNRGIAMFSGRIESTGTGSISLSGVGGVGTDANNGVRIANGSSIVRSQWGDIAVTGIGGLGTGSFNTGVVLAGSTVESTGEGVDSAMITINGTGGGGVDTARGIALGSGTNIRSTNGNILLDGTGTSGDEGFNQGIIAFGGNIRSRGTGPDAASITLIGQAGSGVASNAGIHLLNPDTQISAVDGTIDISGSGADGTGDFQVGVLVSDGAVIRSLGNTDHAGGIRITGNGAAGRNSNRGVQIVSPQTQVTTVAGDIVITGTGGQGNGNFHHGVSVFSGVVESTGRGPGAGRVTLSGIGGRGNEQNEGVLISSPDAVVRSTDGDITLLGTGGADTTSFNRGVIVNGALIESIGEGDHAADITISGTGGEGLNGNRGVQFGGGSTTRVRTIDGDIFVQGRGEGSTDFNQGIIFFGGTVESTGTGPGAGNLTFIGAGADAGNDNPGFHIANDSVQVTTIDGDLSIQGNGGLGTGEDNAGILLTGSIRSTGFGTDAGNISLTGQGGRGSIRTRGIVFLTAGPTVLSVDGDVELEGNGGGGNGFADGVRLFGGILGSQSAGNLNIRGIGGGEDSFGIRSDIPVETRSGSVGLIGRRSDVITGTRSTNFVDVEFGPIGSASMRGNVTITGDTMTLNTVQSSGQLHIQPRTPTTSIGVGAGATGTLTITDDELTGLADGFSKIIIGDPEQGVGPVQLGRIGTSSSNALKDPVEVFGGSVDVDRARSAGIFEPENTISVTARNSSITDDSGGDYFASLTTLSGHVTPGSERPFPDQPISRLTVQGGDLRLLDGSRLTLEIGGPTGGETTSDHDQVVIDNGMLRLDQDVQLEILLLGGYLPIIGQEFVLVRNDGAAPAMGTFAGLPEGELLPISNGFAGRISYVGGDGNDVALEVIGTLDFGDAPLPFPTEYPIGAAHLAVGPRLGHERDSEADGQPTTASLGDDNFGVDDEDGVVFSLIDIEAGSGQVSIDLQNQSSAKVDAWVDFDSDQIWQSDEKILDSVIVNEQDSAETLSFPVNADAILGDVQARVRVSSAGGLDPTGFAVDGEVEDHLVRITQAPSIDLLTINGGSDDRSQLTSIEVRFDGPTDISASAFEVVNRETGIVLTTLSAESETLPNSQTRVTLTFGPNSSLVGTRANGLHTLLDGNYELTIDASKIVRNGLPMKEDVNFGREAADGFFRLYGDTDGDRDVDGIDYIRFAETFLRNETSPSFRSSLDLDGDGDVDGIDYRQFTRRFLRNSRF